MKWRSLGVAPEVLAPRENDVRSEIEMGANEADFGQAF